VATSKVQVSKVGQYVVTIPKPLAQAMGLGKGSQFVVDDNNGKAQIKRVA